MPSIPQFDTPLRFNGSDFDVVEQGSDEEIADCVEACVRTPIGSRMDAPNYGIPDEAFRQLGSETSAAAYLEATERDEPRAHLLGTVEIRTMGEKIVLAPDRTSA